LGKLRDKLARGNLTGVAFLIVNDQDAHSRAMYWELKRRTAQDIPVYQQSPLKPDIWETLDGDKNDFLVYDRCGLLTFHIVLPYSFLHYPYVEAAIRATHQENNCNCT
ncbi:selenoprotein Pb-like, partial [Clarias magur]